MLTLTPAEWRQQALCFRQMAEDETDPHLKRRLEQHALALAEHAQKLERKAALWEETARWSRPSTRGGRRLLPREDKNGTLVRIRTGSPGV